MERRTNRRSLVFGTLALLARFSPTSASADPLYSDTQYTVTNLGSIFNANLITAGGSTLGLGSQLSYADQLVGVTNGQVSYSFQTTPDTAVQQSSVPTDFPSGTFHAETWGGGLMNANGLAAVVASAPSNSTEYYYNAGFAYAVQQTANGGWDSPVSIITTPGVYPPAAETRFTIKAS